MTFEVVSGGQTGVDLAGLRAAEAFSVLISGYVPRDYTNETGPYGIPERFRPFLKETTSTTSAERTRLNIERADGILTLLCAESDHSAVSNGTQLGIDHARELGKRGEQLCFVNLEDVDIEAETDRVLQWIQVNNVERCAIGGPRESEASGIEALSFTFLTRLFEKIAASEVSV